MLDTDTKRRIDTARDILVGKVPDPKSQVEQITIALIYIERIAKSPFCSHRGRFEKTLRWIYPENQQSAHLQ